MAQRHTPRMRDVVRAEINFDSCVDFLRSLKQLREQVQPIKPQADPVTCANGRCLSYFLSYKQGQGDAAQIKDQYFNAMDMSILQLQQVVRPWDEIISKMYDKCMELTVFFSRKDKKDDGSEYLTIPKTPSNENEKAKPRIMEILAMLDDDLCEHIIRELKNPKLSTALWESRIH